MKQRLRRYLPRLGLGLGLWVVGHVLLTVASGLRDDLRKVDLIVVLGNEVYQDGTVSPRLAARLERAAEVYRLGWGQHLLVSGGIDPRGNNEAEVMRGWLVKAGVPSDRILLDPDGWTTRHTARNTARLLQARGWNSVMVVSHYYHISRCRLAMRQAGIKTVASAHASSPELREPYAIGREFVGYYAYLVR
ncbi:MAG: YdcF family protein [Candidatus Eremiobacteraeota bacterium]|nr:YdcF family protein [Candidatus Eremiobacteraeota bacterium]